MDLISLSCEHSDDWKSKTLRNFPHEYSFYADGFKQSASCDRIAGVNGGRKRTGSPGHWFAESRWGATFSSVQASDWRQLRWLRSWSMSTSNLILTMFFLTVAISTYEGERNFLNYIFDIFKNWNSFTRNSNRRIPPGRGEIIVKWPLIAHSTAFNVGLCGSVDLAVRFLRWLHFPVPGRGIAAYVSTAGRHQIAIERSEVFC